MEQEQYNNRKYNDILIVGGSCAVGIAIARQFLREGRTVINVDGGDDFNFAGNGMYAGMYTKISDEKIKPEDILYRFEPDIIINCLSVNYTTVDIIEKTYRLLSAATLLNKNKKQRYIHMSTSDVYGRGISAPAENNQYMPVTVPGSIIASTEMLARNFFKESGLPVIIETVPLVYGPFQKNGFIHHAIKKIFNGMDISASSMISDWTFANDIANATMLIMEYSAVGKKYHVASECLKTEVEVAHILLSEIKKHDKFSNLIDRINVIDTGGNNMKDAVLDAKFFSNILTWKPVVTFEEGIEDTVRWYIECM